MRVGALANSLAVLPLSLLRKGGSAVAVSQWHKGDLRWDGCRRGSRQRTSFSALRSIRCCRFRRCLLR